LILDPSTHPRISALRRNTGADAQAFLAQGGNAIAS
jgi:hypothetical protein